jgi:hypothetical protein
VLKLNTQNAFEISKLLEIYKKVWYGV